MYELFKPANCGNDLIMSLTKMFNIIKATQIIPSFFQSMSITSIWKQKGAKNLLRNERGLFNLSKVRILMDKLLYNDVYQAVDDSLSCSNVGGRRGRGIRDQLFIIYGIINEVINGKSPLIDFQSIDVVQCFDKLNFAETHNDLWDAQIKDDKFSLIANLDRKCRTVIKTPVGESKPFTLTDIIMQGSVFGSLKCTVQVDTLGRDCLSSEDSIGLFLYKDIVHVPPPSFVDDVLGISECGVQTKELNSVINSKIESKKLSLGPDKCGKLHISKGGKGNCPNELKVHNESMKNKTQLKYLGEILNIQGNINDTILERSTRAIGLRTQIKSLN